MGDKCLKYTDFRMGRTCCSLQNEQAAFMTMMM